MEFDSALSGSECNLTRRFLIRVEFDSALSNQSGNIFYIYFLKRFLFVAFIKDNYFMVYNVLQYIQYVALYLLLFDAAAASLLGSW